MSKTLLLKNAQVACGLGVYDADVLIGGGKIKAVLDRGHDIRGDDEVDLCGKIILPGLIDAHVHFREPGAAYKEDWGTGSKAAVASGVTTVLDMPNNAPPIVDIAGLEAKRALVDGRSYCNYGFYIGFNGSNVEEINAAENVSAVKFYACDSTGNMGVRDLSRVESFFEKCEKLIVVHAEDHRIIAENTALYLAEFEGRKIDPRVHSKIRSVEAAVKSLKLVCKLAKKYKKRLHIAHVSSEAELEIINKYRKYGVTCEMAPHHALLCEDDYETLKNFIKVNPPVRSRVDIFGLWKAIKFGEIDIIATDHAPHTIVEKEQGYLEAPSGIPELDTLMPILMNSVNDEGLAMAEVVKLCCEKPAAIFGLKGKGQVEVGYDADLVVVDMNLVKEVQRESLFTKCGWSPYEGMSLKGWPVMTFVGGQLIFKDGKIVGGKAGREVKIG